MTEQRESLSALMDGEASEIEVHRLLRQMGEDAELKTTWLSWHQVRGVIQDRGGETRLPLDAHLDLHSRISAAIADEPAYDNVVAFSGTGTQSGTIGFPKPAAAMAMAASLVVAVVAGMQIESNLGVTPAPEVAETSETVTLQRPEPLYAAQPVAAPTEMPELDQELRELDEEGQQRLRAYLQQHDRLARMKGDQQFVTYPNN